MSKPTSFQALEQFSLLSLARQVVRDADTYNEEKKKAQNDLLAAIFLGLTNVLVAEAPQWSPGYAAQVLERWKQQRSYLGSLPSEVGRRAEVEEAATRVEVAFLDHKVYPWASPRGTAPKGMNDTKSQLKHALWARQWELADRLMDWPGSAEAIGNQYESDQSGTSFTEFQEGWSVWSGLVRNASPGAIEWLLDRGMPPMGRDKAGRPCLAYACTSVNAELLIQRGADFLNPKIPFEQRRTDLNWLLQGWGFALGRHLFEPEPNQRNDHFSAPVAYLEQRLAQWPDDERRHALLPWVSDHMLTLMTQGGQGRTDYRQKFQAALAQWTAKQSGASKQDLLAEKVREGDREWTFEQWTAVRYLRGHTPTPSQGKLPPPEALKKALHSGERLDDFDVLTQDLHHLVHWFHLPNGLSAQAVNAVPLDRLVPLLIAVMEGDTKPFPTDRKRMDRLVMNVVESDLAQTDPLIASLLVAYTHWTWQAPRNNETVHRTVLDWVVHGNNAQHLSPEEQHFVLFNHMTSSTPPPKTVADKAWKILAASIEKNGHLNDKRSPALAHSYAAHGELKRTPKYQSLVKSAALDERLPSSKPAVSKPRF